jgi:hypothetical protein
VRHKQKINDDRGVLIDRIQSWFLQRNKFWTVITVVAIASITILQFSVTFLTQINPHIRQAIHPILVPLLLLFVLSIFWRNTVTTFLSLAGAMCLYAGMYYAYVSRFACCNPSVATVAEFYFLMGIFSAMLCIGVAFKPSFFRAKGTPVGLPYPVWTSNNPELKFGTNNSLLSLIPVQSLLSEIERYMISNYKYIQVMIEGRIYFVSLDEWVPQSSTYIVREKGSGSLIGIPKIADGFNIW